MKTVLLGRTHVSPVTILKTVACPILFRPHSCTVIPECHVFVPCFHENARATHIVAPKELCGEGPVVLWNPTESVGKFLANVFEAFKESFSSRRSVEMSLQEDL